MTKLAPPPLAPPRKGEGDNVGGCEPGAASPSGSMTAFSYLPLVRLAAGWELRHIWAPRRSGMRVAPIHINRKAP